MFQVWVLVTCIIYWRRLYPLPPSGTRLVFLWYKIGLQLKVPVDKLDGIRREFSD